MRVNICTTRAEIQHCGNIEVPTNLAGRHRLGAMKRSHEIVEITRTKHGRMMHAITCEACMEEPDVKQAVLGIFVTQEIIDFEQDIPVSLMPDYNSPVRI